MLNAKYESLQKKPLSVPFLSVALQIILTYMFCAGSYAVYGESISLMTVSSIRDGLRNVTEVTFQAVATEIMCLCYIGVAIGLLVNTLISWRHASVIKKLFRAEEVDVLQARARIGKLVLPTRRTVFASLAFLSWTRILSIFSFPASLLRSFFFILLMCVLVEAKAFSYIQGKRGAFSFGKSLCGYLLAVATVVAVFNLKEKTLYDFAIGLIALENEALPASAMEWAYFLQANVIVYLAPLLFALGLFRPARILFRGLKNVAGTERVKKAVNSYVFMVVLFLIATCVLFGLHDGAQDARYYLDLLSEYVLIIVFAVLIKLLSLAVNRRLKFPVKIMEAPVDERHTLD